MINNKFWFRPCFIFYIYPSKQRIIFCYIYVVSFIISKILCNSEGTCPINIFFIIFSSHTLAFYLFNFFPFYFIVRFKIIADTFCYRMIRIFFQRISNSFKFFFGVSFKFKIWNLKFSCGKCSSFIEYNLFDIFKKLKASCLAKKNSFFCSAA